MEEEVLCFRPQRDPTEHSAEDFLRFLIFPKTHQVVLVEKAGDYIEEYLFGCFVIYLHFSMQRYLKDFRRPRSYLRSINPSDC